MLLKKPLALSHEQFGRLCEALAYLSDKQKAVLDMRFWQDMTTQQIASRIGLSWKSTDEFIESTINHLRVRLVQQAEAPTTGSSAKIYQFKCGNAA